MKVKYLFKAIVLFAVLSNSNLYAQTEDKLVVGFGYSQGSSTDAIFDWDTYDYSFKSFRVHINYLLFQSRKWNYEMSIEPSYYRTTFSELEGDTGPYSYADINEFALNVGFVAKWRIGGFVHVYGILSSGPEYLDYNTGRQKAGFAMSNIAGVGFTLNWEKFILDFRSGLRHVSNAGSKKPNRGYNSGFTGLVVLFKTRPNNKTAETATSGSTAD